MDNDLLEMYLQINKIEQPSDFNSWDHVRKIRAKINEDKYTMLIGLEHSWAILSDDYNNPKTNGKDLIDREADDRVAKTPLAAFLYYINSGFYPPPEVMRAIHDCFELYEQCQGAVELEDVFYGTRVKKRGNHAQRESRGNLFFYFDAVSVWEAKPSNKSLEEIAEDFLTEKGINKDVDSFLRGYRRWKKNNRNKNLPDN